MHRLDDVRADLANNALRAALLFGSDLCIIGTPSFADGHVGTVPSHKWYISLERFRNYFGKVTVPLRLSKEGNHC